jgi:hypothetical protein
VHEAKLSGSEESAIESGENEPAGQAAHEGDAGTPENVPGAQTEHADWPGATEKVPTEHCEQKERLRRISVGWVDAWVDGYQADMERINQMHIDDTKTDKQIDMRKRSATLRTRLQL